LTVGHVECLRVRTGEDRFLDGLVSFCDCDIDRADTIRESVLPKGPEQSAGVEALTSYSSRAVEGNVFVEACEPAITVMLVPGVVGTRNEDLRLPSCCSGKPCASRDSRRLAHGGHG
jgi:hypothetical protein